MAERLRLQVQNGALQDEPKQDKNIKQGREDQQIPQIGTGEGYREEVVKQQSVVCSNS